MPEEQVHPPCHLRSMRVTGTSPGSVDPTEVVQQPQDRSAEEPVEPVELVVPEVQVDLEDPRPCSLALTAVATSHHLPMMVAMYPAQEIVQRDSPVPLQSWKYPRDWATDI